MSLLQINNLNVRFGDANAVPVVDGLDLAVDAGEILAIVGESGSGKSVTMMALMGLIDAPGRITADALTFDGTDMLKLSGRQRRKVVGKDIARNRLIVGWDDMSSDGLYAGECVVGGISALDGGLLDRKTVEAQPRYRAKAEPARMEAVGEDRVRLTFHTPQRAIAPGQICAFYQGGRLLGGGVFESVA